MLRSAQANSLLFSSALSQPQPSTIAYTQPSSVAPNSQSLAKRMLCCGHLIQYCDNEDLMLTS